MERTSLFIFKPTQQSYSKVSALVGNVFTFFSSARLHIKNGVILQDEKHCQWVGHWQGAKSELYLKLIMPIKRIKRSSI